MAMKLNSVIDLEWDNFISTGNYDDNVSSDEEEDINEINHDSLNYISANIIDEISVKTPKPTDIYISTKTKISYLNTPIDLKSLFWGIPVIPYYKPCNGVVKKQMKFNSLSIEELDIIKVKLQDEYHYDEYVITSINNPAGRIKFKDIRKVSIGVSKKDLLSYRCKKKSAFYNCFVLILRILVNDTFKEFHVKVFNTGKVEIPGIQNECTFQMVLKLVIETLQPHSSFSLEFKENSDETVLINSNFNCGFFIDREILNDILKKKYNIQCIYDPCSYPGIQCKFYYDEKENFHTGSIITEEDKLKCKNIKEVSFMIFRTGSVLIVGKCDESILYIIYEFLKEILLTEYNIIRQKNVPLVNNGDTVLKDKKKKIRRKNIVVSMNKANLTNL
jgi:TATA-box binding protein (TBP) (component of TFIID and TFIIIB)